MQGMHEYYKDDICAIKGQRFCNLTDCHQSATDWTSHASKLFEHAASFMGWGDKLSAGKNSLTSSLGLL
jgi:hypothetical protein